MKFNSPYDTLEEVASLMSRYWQAAPKLSEAALIQANNIQQYWAGILQYMNSFNAPASAALDAFLLAEQEKLPEHSPIENLRDYLELLNFNLLLANKGMAGSLAAVNSFYFKKLRESFASVIDTFAEDGGKDAVAFASEQDVLYKVAVQEYPKAIKDIKSEYGFHFENPGYSKAAETERFELWQVLPTNPDAPIADNGKPILIIPPYVLGANILAFLPGEQRSYVHCFANQGIPTYIRIVKDIETAPAVQVMTGEDDALDIRYFCEQLMSRHGRQITLNGFCQGGYHSLAAILSGELDGLVDAFITCATPIDGSRSKSLTDYMNSLPERFRDLKYSLKTLPNGNRVVDGNILSWVYKLRKMETESPIPAYHRDLSMFDGQRGPKLRINKTAAAVNQWLTYDQVDLPVEITRMVFHSYTTPIDEQGNLPVELFGRVLNIKRIEEKGIPWLVCIADNDDLVDKEASLVAMEYIDVEVCAFPKGHASLATSWSIPTSECALQLCFCYSSPVPFPPGKKAFRGPVRFQLDLQGETEKPDEPSGQTTAGAVAEMRPESLPEEGLTREPERSPVSGPEMMPTLRPEAAVPMKVQEGASDGKAPEVSLDSTEDTGQAKFEEPESGPAAQPAEAEPESKQAESRILSWKVFDENIPGARSSIVPELAMSGTTPEIVLVSEFFYGAIPNDSVSREAAEGDIPEYEPLIAPQMSTPGASPEIGMETSPAREPGTKAAKQRRKRASTRGGDTKKADRS